MSATVIRKKRQTTLPDDVCQAAGLKVRDQVDWRVEEGEIRGRVLKPTKPIVRKAKLVRREGKLVFDVPELPEDAIVKAIDEFREE
jgi:bifunctional DNA-binding transcriptional regulator/antitoxin component of YhaV-PrlF toxin-antitoxin module